MSDLIDVKEAKLREMNNWKDHQVYVEVPNEGQNYITTRWVLTEKIIDGKNGVKARLVARGFEEENLKNLRTDSPTCGKESLRILISIIVSKEWQINSLDIKAAFLQGKEIKRTLFLKPPIEAKTTNL